MPFSNAGISVDIDSSRRCRAYVTDLALCRPRGAILINFGGSVSCAYRIQWYCRCGWAEKCWSMDAI